VAWGEKAFSGYLGNDRAAWRDYDATALVEHQRFRAEILIDQGSADKFLDEQLRPHLFAAACAKAGQPLRLRMQDGYDHSYYFIQTFMPEHVAWHAAALVTT
jgi:S-formylglutathione hydrolase